MNDETFSNFMHSRKKTVVRKNPVVGEKVYVLGTEGSFRLYFLEATIKKIRGSTLGLDFTQAIPIGHDLEGLSTQCHGYWINSDNSNVIICSKNMEKFYSMYCCGD